MEWLAKLWTNSPGPEQHGSGPRATLTLFKFITIVHKKNPCLCFFRWVKGPIMSNDPTFWAKQRKIRSERLWQRIGKNQLKLGPMNWTREVKSWLGSLLVVKLELTDPDATTICQDQTGCEFILVLDMSKVLMVSGFWILPTGKFFCIHLCL